MRELSLQEIRVKTLDLMDHIHELCVKNGIPYFLHYGTLIGAVRHNGFIPWDDDFDIAMKRSDYRKFCKAVERENSSVYKLCNRANTDNYYYGIARYADTRYKYVSELKGLKQADIGVFIDVYPLDNLGNTKEEAIEIKKKANVLNRDYIIYTNKTSLQGPLHTLARIPLHYYYRLKYGKDFRFKVDQMIYRRIRSLTSDQDRQIGLACWDVTCWPYEREWFDEACLHQFEDRQYYIPVQYDKVLRMVYGDYMQLPPEEKRVPTHSYHIYEKTENN